jgi:hypothetical protein
MFAEIPHHVYSSYRLLSVPVTTVAVTSSAEQPRVATKGVKPAVLWIRAATP